MTIKKSIITGIVFGITSGIITTLGLLVGLSAGTNSKLAVVGGILTIAIADAFSDALGIHISEEADKDTTTKDVWESTIATFMAKLLFALTFLIPVLLTPLNIAVWVCIAWGLSVLTILSYWIAAEEKSSKLNAIVEHLSTTILVIVISNWVGNWISTVFI